MNASAICINNDCPLAYKCFRHNMQVPDTFKDFWRFEPKIKGREVDCDGYIPEQEGGGSPERVA